MQNGNVETPAFVLREPKKKKAETIKNDPRECIRVDNILKQNVTRFPRVSTPSPPCSGGLGGERELSHSLAATGCHCGLWCRNSANFLIYN